MFKEIIDKLQKKRKVFGCCMIFCIFAIYLYAVKTYPKIEFNLSSTNVQEPLCVFYADKNMEDFDAQHMIQAEIQPGMQTYSFALPDVEVLRIDFGTDSGLTQIGEVTVKTLFEVKKASVQYMSECNFSVDVGAVAVEGGMLSVESIGADPYVILGNLDGFEKSFNVYGAAVLIASFILSVMISGIAAIYGASIVGFVIKMIKGLKEVWGVRFCCCIAALSLFGVIYLYNVYPRIEFELSSSNPGETVQVYYDNGNSDFDGEHMLWSLIGSGCQKYSFHIPDSNILRIDFGTSEGISQISNIKIKKIFTVKEIPISFMESCKYSSDVESVSVEGNGLLVKSIGYDPHIIIGNLNEIGTQFNRYNIGIYFLVFVIIVILSEIIIKYYKVLAEFLRKDLFKTIKLSWSRPFCRCMIFFLVLGAVYLCSTYPRIEFEMTNTNSNESVQVYYDNGNMEFDGNHMVKDLIGLGHQKYSFSISNSDILRIDFATSPGTAQISNVRVKNIFTVKELPARFIAMGDLSTDVGSIEIEEDKLSVRSIGLDPYIVIKNINAIDDKFNMYSVGMVCLAVVAAAAISWLIAKYYMGINHALTINKRRAAGISVLFFLVYRIIFLIRHVGFFAIDEFRHIATVNPDYITDYRRAVYINHMAEIICKIFGQSDYAVKAVPFLMGVISFLCALYLLYNIYDNPYWILTVSVILTCLPYVIFNHSYIRMYAFFEAVIMLNCVLFYNAEKRRGTKWEKISLLIVGVLTVLYTGNTKDLTASALLLLMLAAAVYYLYKNYFKSKMNKNFLKKIWKILLVVCCGAAIAVGAGWDRIKGILGTLVRMSSNERFYVDTPVFLEYIFIKMFYISIPFLISFVYIWRKKEEDKKNLFMIAGLPLAVYAVVLHNVYYLRTYNAFIPIMCIIAYLVFDKLKLSELQHWAIIIVVMVLTINAEDNFWKFPAMTNEVAFANLSDAVTLAKELEKQGYEIVPVLTDQRQLAYFDLLEVDTNLDIEDIKTEIWESRTGIKYNDTAYKDEKLIREAKDIINNGIMQIFESNDKKVLITDESGTGIFWSVFDEQWNEKCEVRRFAGNVDVIIVN